MSTFWCVSCDVARPDANHWCSRLDCPAEGAARILDYGERLGELKIIRAISQWQGAALYEAHRPGSQPVWVKIAMARPAFAERIANECALWVATNKPHRRLAARRPRLTLTPALAYAYAKRYAPSVMTVDHAQRTYAVYEAAAAVPIAHLLNDLGCLWHYDAAWCILALTEALRPLVRNRRAHLDLQRAHIGAQPMPDGRVRVMLWDMGWLASDQQTPDTSAQARQWANAHYAAPELLRGSADFSGLAADVYALGALYFELLCGRHTYAEATDRPEQVRAAVLAARRPPDLGRPELIDPMRIADIVERALAPSPDKRYANATSLGDALRAIYGMPPWLAGSPLTPILRWLFGAVNA